MNARRLAFIPLLAAQLTSSAIAGDFSWTLQRTGFRSTSSVPQTALSMRSDLSWPVVYGIDQGMLNAYSLFPVLNPNPKPIPGEPTYWHQIGTNLTKSSVPTSNVFLQGASGSPDGFGVSLQTSSSSSFPPDATVWGTSQGGFQPPQNNTQAIKFDNEGNPFVASTSLIPFPTPRPSDKIFDIALSKNGEVGAITQFGGGTGPITFWQRSPLLGGNWFSSSFTTPQLEQTLFGPSVDLTYDASARPHIVGVNRVSSNNNIAAYRFDVISGLWQSATLDVGSSGFPPIADVAAASNDDGIVGAAWVNGGVVKYAYLDTNEVAPQWNITTVASTTPTGMQLEMAQGVGLEFDKAGLPVISFVERGSRQIWIAYDPPLLTTPTPALEGDFNGDGFVDGSDLGDWQSAMGDGDSAADANGDGHTDGTDFLAWQRNLTGDSTPVASAAIPEPATLTLCLVAATVVLRTSRRRGAI